MIVDAAILVAGQSQLVFCDCRRNAVCRRIDFSKKHVKVGHHFWLEILTLRKKRFGLLKFVLPYQDLARQKIGFIRSA